MEPLIRMRLLLGKLNDNEYDQFLCSVVDTFGKKKYVSFIFGYFLHFIQYETHHEELKQVVELISNIIELRRDKSDKQSDNNDCIAQNASKIHTEPLLIDRLPNEMIRECASYLAVDEYFTFSLCNRRIYVAVNSPCAISFFVTADYQKYHQCDLNRFTLLQHLDVEPKSYNKYIQTHPKMKIFRNLSILSLQSDSEVVNQNDFDTFFDIKSINWCQIDVLRLNFNGLNGSYDFQKFCLLLKQCPNVKYLKLINVELSEYDNKLVKELLPNIKGFEIENCCVNTDSLMNAFIENKFNQIKSLIYDCSQIPAITRHIWNGKFKHLEELHIEQAQHLLTGNLNSLQTVQRLFVNIYDDISPNIFCRILQRLSAMHHFGIYVEYSLFDKIGQYLLSMLLNTARNKEKLRIVFAVHVGEFKNSDLNPFNEYIMKMVSAFDECGIKYYMFDFVIWFDIFINKDSDITRIEENVNTVQLIDKLKETHLVHCGVIEDEEQYRIVISNKDCIFNGYDERGLDGITDWN